MVPLAGKLVLEHRAKRGSAYLRTLCVQLASCPDCAPVNELDVLCTPGDGTYDQSCITFAVKRCADTGIAAAVSGMRQAHAPMLYGSSTALAHAP